MSRQTKPNAIVRAWHLFKLTLKTNVGRQVKYVGEDEAGNVYYEEFLPNQTRKVRRYYVNKAISEETSPADFIKVPPGWDSWLRFRRQDPPKSHEPQPPPEEQSNQQQKQQDRDQDTKKS